MLSKALLWLVLVQLPGLPAASLGHITYWLHSEPYHELDRMPNHVNTIMAMHVNHIARMDDCHNSAPAS